MNAVALARMIDVLKETWIYQLQAGEDRDEKPGFRMSDLKEIAYGETNNVPGILVTLKDGTQRLAHPYEFNMQEIEILTTWAEDRGRKP